MEDIQCMLLERLRTNNSGLENGIDAAMDALSVNIDLQDRTIFGLIIIGFRVIYLNPMVKNFE